MLWRLEWGTTVEEVTDDRIIAELDKIVGNVMNDAILDVDAIFDDELKINHGMASIFSTETGKKEKCNILRKHLEPAVLREAVDTHLRIVDASSKSDESALYMLVKEKALEHERVYQLLAKRRHQPSTPHNTGKTKSDGDQGSRHGNQRTSSDRKVEKSSERPRSVQIQTKSAAAPQSKPRTGCFHCGKDHYLSQCPDLDEAAKEAILAERKSKRGVNNDKNKKLRSKRVDALSTTNNVSCSTVVINGSLELPYCADSDSDMNIISRKHVDLLREQDTAVMLVELDAPITSRAVGGALLTSTHTVEVRLTRNTAAGPVRCQDAKKCLIVETDKDEFIVGKLLLAELGIDMDRQLEYLATRGIEGDDPCDDPEGMPPCTPAVGDVVVKVVDALVRDAMDRGVIDEYTTSRLYGVDGGWRLELGDDPPARVPPLAIRLRPGATPYRCKATV